MQDCKLLMTADEGGEWRDLARSAPTKFSVKTKSISHVCIAFIINDLIANLLGKVIQINQLDATMIY